MHRQAIAREGRQFGRYIAVGVLNTAFGYGIYAILIFIGLHYALASLMATLLGILFNFFTTGRIVFRNADNSRLLKFFIVYGVVYVFNLAGLAVMDLLHVDLYLAGLVMVPPGAILAYILNHRFVFGGKK